MWINRLYTVYLLDSESPIDAIIKAVKAAGFTLMRVERSTEPKPKTAITVAMPCDGLGKYTSASVFAFLNALQPFGDKIGRRP